MDLTVTQHAAQETFNIEWIEVNTAMGNRVIQEGHAPLIIVLKPQSTVNFFDKKTGKQSLGVAGGILSIHHDQAILVLTD